MPKFEAKCDHCGHAKFITDLSDLKCDQCGAPLSDFKRVEEASHPQTAQQPIVVERVVEREIVREVPSQGSKFKGKKKKKKGLFSRIADAADDVFDIFD